jgi:hypothetical protein
MTSVTPQDVRLWCTVEKQGADSKDPAVRATNAFRYVVNPRKVPTVSVLAKRLCPGLKIDSSSRVHFYVNGYSIPNNQSLAAFKDDDRVVIW